jgi:hypothetical protein
MYPLLSLSLLIIILFLPSPLTPPPPSPSPSPAASILPELSERADEIRQSLLAVPALADPQVHPRRRVVTRISRAICSASPASVIQPAHSLVFFPREQKLQEFLSNAAKSGNQAEAGQGERSDVTVAALLGGVKRRGDVADEGEAA